MKHELKIGVETSTKIEGTSIIQRVVFLNTKIADGQELARRVGDTAEAGLRDALIKLGWTPPKDQSKPIDNEHF